MRAALAVSALAALAISPAFAQPTPAPCTGDLAIVRVSTIKPGKLQDFLAAVDAHKAWYRNHGFKDNVIVASRVILTDGHTRATRYSEAEVITYHVRPPGPAQTDAKHDAAWQAYVKQYRDSSAIKNEYLTCMPKLAP